MKRVWFTVYFTDLIWSAVNPHDHFTWFLEALPALIGFIIIIATRNRFPLTPIAYTLILLRREIAEFFEQYAEFDEHIPWAA